MLSITNLHASVDGKQILNGLDLQVAAGEVHAIMGPNGSGKSTVLNALAGLATIDGDIGIWDNPSLTTIGMSSLTSVRGLAIGGSPPNAARIAPRP